MKYYHFIFLITSVSLCACSNENYPNTPINKTGYRLDSVEYYDDDVLLSKQVYYYSISSIIHYDSMYVYNVNNGYCELSTRETYIYDEQWKLIEESLSSYKNSQWCLNNTYYWQYRSDEWRQSKVTWNAQGVETYREDISENTDSYGNPVLVITKTYSYGNLHSYWAKRNDNYYSENHLDSIYTYKQKNEYSSFEPASMLKYYYNGNRLDSLYQYSYQTSGGQGAFICTNKEIYSMYENNICTESIHYICKNNIFTPYDMRRNQFDLYSNVLLDKYYSWENDNWKLRWIVESSYLYIPDTDMVEESTSIITDFDKEGNVVRVKSKRKKSYYTKIN